MNKYSKQFRTKATDINIAPTFAFLKQKKLAINAIILDNVLIDKRVEYMVEFNVVEKLKITANIR